MCSLVDALFHNLHMSSDLQRFYWPDALSCCSFVLVDQPAEDLAAPYPQSGRVGNRLSGDGSASGGRGFRARCGRCWL